MKFAAYLLVFLALFAFAFARFYDCEIGGVRLQVGENHSPIGECLVYTCMGPNEWSALGCPHDYNLSRDCIYYREDVSKPYPHCCPGYAC